MKIWQIIALLLVVLSIVWVGCVGENPAGNNTENVSHMEEKIAKNLSDVEKELNDIESILNTTEGK